MLSGNRKFVVAGGAMLLGFVLALAGKLSGEFVTIASVAVGSFAASNAYEHHAKSKQ
jgi:hypothetical protein